MRRHVSLAVAARSRGAYASTARNEGWDRARAARVVGCQHASDIADVVVAPDGPVRPPSGELWLC